MEYNRTLITRDFSGQHREAILGIAQGETELIHEHRTRLIADVVTGRLDMRGVPLPVNEDVGIDGAGDEIETIDEESEMDEPAVVEEADA